MVGFKAQKKVVGINSRVKRKSKQKENQKFVLANAVIIFRWGTGRMKINIQDGQMTEKKGSKQKMF